MTKKIADVSFFGRFGVFQKAVLLLLVCVLMGGLLAVPACSNNKGLLLDRPVGPKKGVGEGSEQARYKGELPTTYIVKRLDSLWRIAVYFYGDGKQWKRIADANEGITADSPLIKPGMKLTIPK